MKQNPKFETSDGTVIYKNLSRKGYLDLMSRVEHIRVLICEDGTVYGFDKAHEDVIKALNAYGAQAFNLGSYQFDPEGVLDIIMSQAKKYKTRNTKKGV